MVDNHFHHRESGRTVHAGTTPAFSHPHTHPHPHSHHGHTHVVQAPGVGLTRIASATPPTLNGMNPQMGAFYQFQSHHDLMPPAMHGYSPGGHQLPHGPFM